MSWAHLVSGWRTSTLSEQKKRLQVIQLHLVLFTKCHPLITDTNWHTYFSLSRKKFYVIGCCWFQISSRFCGALSWDVWGVCNFLTLQTWFKIVWVQVTVWLLPWTHTHRIFDFWFFFFVCLKLAKRRIKKIMNHSTKNLLWTENHSAIWVMWRLRMLWNKLLRVQIHR